MNLEYIEDDHQGTPLPSKRKKESVRSGKTLYTISSIEGC